MSTSVLCSRGGLAVSRAACRQALTALGMSRIRPFSAASSDEPYVATSHTQSGPRTVWPDENMGPFGPQDQRFQLPGNVGFDCHLEGMGDNKAAPVHKTVPDVLTTPSSSERHEFILAQFISQFQGNEGSVYTRVRKAELYFDQNDTDCYISSCPELLRKDLELFFPTAPASSLTVVTVAQKSGRPEEPEQNKDQMLHRFVNGAKEMCFALWTAGYWADFIDPTTGLAFFGSPSSQTSLRTDGELQQMGFHIEVSGSCTVIRHILKGTPMFVGTVFTNAPTYSPAVNRLQGLPNALDDDS
ncbi:cobalamin trafficking protein CblD-like [Lampris incognitus]|uniref:cobalamin trafficking protein CblD-like n=1 Tax=Lampris incognitus TaxID=2546036 RepID=UPI0024B60C90|nr:cobalamin trafficking protein CblD-like [Lampris incognitus]XP_056157208.1 cobalamin trafficking protein CblD-like [Lampris incognitus]XP_056157209.1 cobalamin trafficking protein CblD-like [Lampris incognitus]